MTLALSAHPPPLATDRDGVVRVGGTRVTLDTIVQAFQEGLSAEEIHLQYPSVSLAAVYSAIAYCLEHRDEVDEYLVERGHQAQAVRREIAARFDQSGIRERLLARRNA